MVGPYSSSSLLWALPPFLNAYVPIPTFTIYLSLAFIGIFYSFAQLEFHLYSVCVCVRYFAQIFCTKFTCTHANSQQQWLQQQKNTKRKKKKKKKNDHALKIITQEERVRFFSCPIKRTKKNKFIYLDWILYFRNNLNIPGGSWRNAEQNQFKSLWVFFGSCSSSLWTLRLFFRFHRMPNITILNKTTNTFGNISSSTMQIHLSPYFVKSLISQTH